jgi:hypothetical protein
MIPPEYKEEIINDGIHFMRTITECYGAEEGMKLWDQIVSVLDPCIKGDIFFAMLTGSHGRLLKVSGVVTNRVQAIKAIRTVSGLGLKEAKDRSDEMQSGKTVTIEIMSGVDRSFAIKHLRESGMKA